MTVEKSLGTAGVQDQGNLRVCKRNQDGKDEERAQYCRMSSRGKVQAP